jgi:RHS repeat-associated protein
VAGYELEYRTEAGSWTAWLTATTATTATFSALPQHQYYFRIRAIDRVGHLGAWVEAGPVEIKAVTKYYHFGQQRVAMRQGGVVYYLHGDHLGSTTLTTDDTGAVVAQSRYLPHGQLRWTSGASPTDFGFTGQRDETSFGLMDYNARYYDPLSGRFISPDTVVPEPGNPQTLNRYSYVNNNPLRYKDPSGHWIESALDIAGIAYDIYDIHQNGLNWENGLSLTADVAGLILPGVTGGGLAVRAVMHADDAIRLANRADDVVDVVTHADEVLDAVTYADEILEAATHADELADVAQSADNLATATKRIPKQTTVLGNGYDTAAFRELIEETGETGYNVLHLPRDGGTRYGAGLNNHDPWSPKLNTKWLDGAIRRGDDIYLATNPKIAEVNRFFQMELDYLEPMGYVQEGLYMVKK